MSCVPWERQSQEMRRELVDVGVDGVDELLRQWIIGNKAERNRTILRMHLFKGMTYEEIAEELGMSSRSIGSICRKGEEVLARHMPRS